MIKKIINHVVLVASVNTLSYWSKNSQEVEFNAILSFRNGA